MTERDLRPPRLRRALLAALCAAAACLAAGALATRPADGAPAQPNIVLIVTDDQAVSDLYERIGGRKGSRPVMPHTLSLFRDRGVTFSRSYSSNPLSCPARSTILTGQYSVNHRVFANRWPGGGFCSDAGRLDLSRSLPVWLRAAGYRTLHYGRFMNGWGTQNKTLVAPGWDEWVNAVDPRQTPAALYYGYHLNENGVISKQYGEVHRRSAKDYFTDVIVGKAIGELRTGNLAAPFFLSIEHRAPHEDLAHPIGPEAALRHVGTLRHQRLSKAPSFNEADVRDKAPFLRQSERLLPRQVNVIRRRNLRRLQSLRAVDEQTRHLLTALQALGELDDTYFIFTSDNGFLRGEHRFIKGKRRPYEPATRVPLIIRGPGLPAGRVSEEVVANVDLAPTILDLAGAGAGAVGRVLDGRSLVPFAVSPGARTSRPILLESYYGRFYDPEAIANLNPSTHTSRPAPTPKTWKGIVLGRWKLVRYAKGVFELYDLRVDPNEMRSLAHRRRYRPVLRYLVARLKVLAHCAGASCRAEIREPKVPRKRHRGPGSGGGA